MGGGGDAVGYYFDGGGDGADLGEEGLEGGEDAEDVGGVWED